MDFKAGVRFPNLAVLAAGGISAALGLSVLLGLQSQSGGLLEILPRIGPLAYSTAAGVLSCGMGLIAIGLGFRVVASYLGVLAALLGSAGLIHQIAGIEFGIADVRQMPAAAGLGLLLAGISLLLMGGRGRQRPLAAGVLGSIITALGLAVLFYYLSGRVTVFRWNPLTYMTAHGAVGFAVIGSGIIALSWRDGSASGKAVSRWASVLVAGAATTVMLYLWQALRGQERAHIQQAIGLTAADLARDVGQEVESRMLALVAIGRQWERQDRPTQAQWEAAASLYIGQFPGSRSMVCLDPSFQVRWLVTTDTGKPALQALNREHLKAARQSRQPTAADLPSDRGLPAWRGAVPLFQGQKFDGWMVGIFGVRELLDANLGANRVGRFSVTVFSGSQEVYQRRSEGQYGNEWAEAKIADRGLDWRVRVWPDQQWLAEEHSPLDDVVLVGGLFMAGLLTLTVHLLQTTRRRSREAEAANKELRENIAQRKLMEAELRRSEQWFRTSLDNILDAFGIFSTVRDESGRILDFLIEYVNDAACAVNGMSREQLVGKRLLEIMPVHPEPLLFSEYCRVVETGQPLVKESVSYASHEQGISKVFDLRAARLGDGFVAAWLDVTANKQAEEARRHSEARYQNLFEGVPVGLYQISPEGEILEANPALVELLGFPDLQTLRSMNASDLYLDREERARAQAVLEQDGVLMGYEMLLRRHNGEVIWVRDTTRAVRDRDGRLLYYEGVLENITERKYATEEIKRSLAEKETLLREIHHRVKNNLQVVSSLLRLQSETIHDPRMQALFEDSRNRVGSMALVHEKLYQSRDLARVNLRDYVRSLAVHLFRSYAGNSDRIRLMIYADDVSLGVDEAIPCGLILNELVSNSLKHAFPQERRGTLRIELAKRETSAFTLTVRDDGIGLPTGFRFESPEALGLQLVKTLAEQLGGSVEVRCEGGTEFRITFPESKGEPA